MSYTKKEFGKADLYYYVHTAKELFYGPECVEELKNAKSKREAEHILSTYRHRMANKEIK